MEQINKILDILQIEKYWRSFMVSFAATFIMAALPYLGVRLDLLGEHGLVAQVREVIVQKAGLLNPQPHKVDALEQIRPRLEEKENTFNLSKPTSFIPPADASEDYAQAKSYIVINYDTGEVIAEKNSDQRMPIASLTKIMTATVALDLFAPEKLFMVSPHAASIEPTKIGAPAGNKLTLSELINALLLTSANDAAQVIKEGIDQEIGSEVFVQAMTEKANILGLSNTHYANPQGFDSKNNYSTASDLAILSKYALTNYSLIAETAQKPYEFLPSNENHKQFDLYNWNGLIGVYPGTFGLKIGNTDDAQKTTVVAAQRDGKKVLVVVLGAPGILERDMWAAQLLDIGFEKLAGSKPVEVTEKQLRAKYATWQ